MKRGMEAVFERSTDAMRGKRTPMLKRKPGLAVMIAVGKPKAGPPRTAVTGQRDEEGEAEGDTCPECGYKHSASEKQGDTLSKAQKIAALEEKIGYLKGELALLKGDGEDEDEMDDEEMPEDGDNEDEDED